MPELDWDHFRVFLSVARHGQLLAAARKLGINHATAARRLSALEAALGQPLFERRPDGSTATPTALQLLPAIERIEVEIMRIVERLRNEDALAAGTVRVGAPEGLGNHFLAAELGTLSTLHPNLVVELVPLPQDFSIAKREVDIAICVDQPSEGRLIVSRLSDCTLSTYASVDYLRKHGEPTALEELSEHVVVVGVEDSTYASALDYVVFLQKYAQRIFRCASTTGQLEATKAGAGIGVLHDFSVTDQDSLVRVLPQIEFRQGYFLVSHPDTADVRRIAVCRDFIARRFREERCRFLRQ